MTHADHCCGVQPVHPGNVLRYMLERFGLNVITASRLLRVTRQQVHRILKQASGVSPEMAVRLGKLFGNGAEFWAQLHNAFELSKARRRLGDVIDVVPTLHARVQHTPTSIAEAAHV